MRQIVEDPFLAPFAEIGGPALQRDQNEAIARVERALNPAIGDAEVATHG